ncbi:MAG: cytochrome c maturation protein CcmE [Bacteroidetes bacterium]|nr:cytochrome c maturation protein CcmE [Bacteroidota bacterium]
MKKSHIIALILIAVSIGAIYSTLADSSTYSNFSEAAKNPDSEFHVVGKLNRDKPQNYEPEKNANLFTFYMFDNDSVEKKIVLHKSKPQDFEKSEQIVIIGKCSGNDFHANEILMKCPSKYNDAVPSATASSNITR